LFGFDQLEVRKVQQQSKQKIKFSDFRRTFLIIVLQDNLPGGFCPDAEVYG